MSQERRSLYAAVVASLAVLVVGALGVAVAQQTGQQGETVAQWQAEPGTTGQSATGEAQPADPRGTGRGWGPGTGYGGGMVGPGGMGPGMMGPEMGGGMMGPGMMGRGMGYGRMGRGMMGEMPMMMGEGPMMMMGVPAITAWGGKVYVAEDGCLFEFDAKTLKLERQTRYMWAPMQRERMMQRGRMMPGAQRMRGGPWAPGQRMWGGGDAGGKAKAGGEQGRTDNW